MTLGAPEFKQRPKGNFRGSGLNFAVLRLTLTSLRERQEQSTSITRQRQRGSFVRCTYWRLDHAVERNLRKNALEYAIMMTN